MRELPRNAVMERRMLTAEENIASCFNAPPKAGEHSSSRNVFACVSFPVKFVVSIILQSFRFFSKFTTYYGKKYFALVSIRKVRITSTLPS